MISSASASKGRRHGNAERFSGLDINNKDKLARLLDREIAGLGAMQNLPGIDARTLGTRCRVGWESADARRPGAHWLELTCAPFPETADSRLRQIARRGRSLAPPSARSRAGRV